MCVHILFSFNSESELEVLPHNSSLFPLIAHLPVTRDFQNKNFGTPFNFVSCLNSGNFSKMFNFVAPKSNLCRNNSLFPFHNIELPFYMLAELINLVTPHGGTVLDPYTGSMSVIISLMNTGDKFFYVEKNSDFYRSAVERLSKRLTSDSKKFPLQDVTCTDHEKAIHIHSKLWKGSTVEDVSTTSAHVKNTSSPQWTKPTTQHISPTSEYSDKYSDVTA